MRLRFSLLLLCGLTAGNCAFGLPHYLDCTAGNDAADSLSPQTAWRTVARASVYTYQPGDSLLLRRGSHCEGMLWPKGSGTEHASIHLSAYGHGALPVIAGGAQPAGLMLHDQQYWEIENLEVIGGSPYGIHIGGTNPVMRHFRVTNVVVHDVPGTPLSKDSGLVVIAPDEKSRSRIDDVILDGVTAYRTSQWAGIIVNGAVFDSADHHDRGERIEIRNSIVHDVAGDGILLARVSHGVLEHNVAWNTGMQETETIGTPNAIWEWRCSDCRVEYNEGYFSDSPGVDGGVFDIDYGNENNLLENNFGHDSQGYCVSVFGAEGPGGNTIQSTIRHNTCIHNGRSPRLARRQGAIYLDTWKGGRLNGVEIAGNTVLWDPPLDVPALRSRAEFRGDLPNRFRGNTIIAASGSFVSSASGIQFAGNRYCGSKRTLSHSSLAARPISDSPIPGLAVSSSPAESDATANKPEVLCACMRDLLRETTAANLRPGAARDSNLKTPSSSIPLAAHWTLLAVLTPPGDPAEDKSKSHLVLMESMMHQFADLGLAGVVLPADSIGHDELLEWQTDWNFDPAIEIDALDAMKLLKIDHLPTPSTLLLVSPSGQAVARWEYPVPPANVWLQLQNHLGTPAGMQQMPVCDNPVAELPTVTE